jgi:hypothetical protein
VKQEDNTQSLQVRMFRSGTGKHDIGYTSMSMGYQFAAELVMQGGSDSLGGLQ